MRTRIELCTNTSVHKDVSAHVLMQLIDVHLLIRHTYAHTTHTHTRAFGKRCQLEEVCKFCPCPSAQTYAHTHTHTCSVSEALTRIGVFNMYVRASHYDDNENRSRTHTHVRDPCHFHASVGDAR